MLDSGSFGISAGEEGRVVIRNILVENNTYTAPNWQQEYGDGLGVTFRVGQGGILDVDSVTIRNNHLVGSVTLIDVDGQGEIRNLVVEDNYCGPSLTHPNAEMCSMKNVSLRDVFLRNNTLEFVRREGQRYTAGGVFIDHYIEGVDSLTVKIFRPSTTCSSTPMITPWSRLPQTFKV